MHASYLAPARDVLSVAFVQHEAPALECSHSLRVSLEAAVATVIGQAAPVLVSGAGHDGMALAQLCDVGMVFVRCRGGVSHSPLENVEPDDITAAIDVLLALLRSEGSRAMLPH